MDDNAESFHIKAGFSAAYQLDKVLTLAELEILHNTLTNDNSLDKSYMYFCKGFTDFVKWKVKQH